VSPREAGTLIDGKYEVVKPLAAGGMGEVYLVRHLHLQEQRVIKVLRQEVAADPAHRQRFLREARLATQIKHPNVAILYDYAQLPEGSFYMVWEHVEGREVGQWLHDEGPFPVPLAIDLGIQALRGLEAIHSLGVIHRDISPDNLMIARDHRGRPRVKIIDLGLAKTLGPDPNYEVTQPGTFMGKLRYCSPEQAESGSGDDLDRRSDLYSLGLVLYEMICAVSPFDHGDRPVFVFQRLSQDPRPLRGRTPGIEVPETLDRAVLRALERDRERRYPDAIGFIEALEGVARGLGEHSTQKVTVPPEVAAAAAVSGRPPRAERGSRSAELSSAERRALLEQIDRAAKRVRESTQVVESVDLAIREGRLAEARRLVADIEAANPAARPLAGLKERLAAAEGAASRGERLAELEQLLTGYIKKRQPQLAQLALDALRELAPGDPRHRDFGSWIEMLREELDRERGVAEALAAGRAALGEGDVKTARKRLEALRKADPTGDSAAAFAAEIERAVTERRRSADLADRKSRFEAALGRGRLDDAEAELAAMGRLGATRVSLDFLRGRLEETRRRSEADRRAADVERRFEERLAVGDFQGARDAALALERALPASPRPAELFAEVARVEEEHRRSQAIEQGERQVAALIRQGRADQAQLALRVLLRIDPKNHHKKQFERQIKALAK
jgi:serine/threonine-protein kinase